MNRWKSELGKFRNSWTCLGQYPHNDSIFIFLHSYIYYYYIPNKLIILKTYHRQCTEMYNHQMLPWMQKEIKKQIERTFEYDTNQCWNESTTNE